MSDHVDGPRTLADPAIDISDLYAFTSPENPQRTVVIANVFPFAGESALFSNVVNYSMALRRVHVAALGDAARFEANDSDIRFTFQFEVLEAAPNGGRLRQTGICKLPDGQTLDLVVSD